MRDRHIPHLCRACGAPLARQEPNCWRCHTPWRQATLRVVPDATDPIAVEAREAVARWSTDGGARARPAATA